MIRKWVLFSTLVLFVLNSTAQVPGTIPTTWKYNTLAHRLLSLEESAFSQPDRDFSEMYGVLDSLIDKAKTKLKPIIGDDRLTEKEKALDILEAIDQTLWEMDFIVAIHTRFMYQALKRTEVMNKSNISFLSRDDRRPDDNTVYYGSYFLSRSNSANDPHIESDTKVTWMSEEKKVEFLAEPLNHYRLIDCDLAAYLYLSIGEIMDLPIYLAGVPEHKFVRYFIDAEEYINWDNNSANDFSDDDFRNCLSPTASTEFDKEDEKNKYYLKTLRMADALAVHSSLIVRNLDSIPNDPSHAQDILDRALESDPEGGHVKHQIAKGVNSMGYSFSMEGDYTTAIGYFESAIELDPFNSYAYDNLGYALIQSGKPDKGKRFLNKAIRTGNNAAAYSMRNEGVYYFARGKFEEAKSCFEEAFKLVKLKKDLKHVDLLEYHYAQILLLENRREEAIAYLKIGAERGEGPAMRELGRLVGDVD